MAAGCWGALGSWSSFFPILAPYFLLGTIADVVGLNFSLKTAAAREVIDVSLAARLDGWEKTFFVKGQFSYSKISRKPAFCLAACSTIKSPLWNSRVPNESGDPQGNGRFM
eukprot:s1121_g4.t1